MRPVTRPTIRSRATATRDASLRRWAVSVACVSAGLLGLAAAPALASTYTMTDLGTLGGLDSSGNAINDLGEVVGTSNTSNKGSSPFTDQNGVMTAINTGDQPRSTPPARSPATRRCAPRRSARSPSLRRAGSAC